MFRSSLHPIISDTLVTGLVYVGDFELGSPQARVDPAPWPQRLNAQRMRLVSVYCKKELVSEQGLDVVALTNKKSESI